MSRMKNVEVGQSDEVMRTTKQKRRYAIDLPQEAMDVLRWHVATLRDQLPDG